MTFLLHPIAPIGATVLDHLCTGRSMEFLRYPPSPRGERLMLRRVGLELSLRDAAAALGISAQQLADLENGRAVLESDAEWDRAEQVLREWARTRPAVQAITRMMGEPR